MKKTPVDDNTFVLLYRKSLDSRVFANEALWKVWTWCLMKASYKERWVTLKTGKATIEVKIYPGQFVYGRLSAAKELGMKPSSVRNRMEKLKKMRNVDIKEDSQYSIVSIVNWNTYQRQINKEDSKEDNQRTIKGQSKDTNNNVNKVNKVNKEKIYTDKQKTFVGRYIKYISETFKNRAPKSTNLENKSLEAIDKLIRIDGFQEDYIFEVLRWAQEDDFWKYQILSLAVVRKKSNNGLTKFQNLVTGYEKNKVAENMAKPENTEGTYAHAIEQQKAREKNKESIT